MKGDGQGGNPGTRLDESEKSIAPCDLLRRQIETHERCATENPNERREHKYHASLLKSKLAKLEKDWKLEAAGGLHRVEQRFKDQPIDMAIAQLDLPERIVNVFEDYGPTKSERVLWVRQLVEWTPAMVLAAEQLGESSLVVIERRLAQFGLRLRTPERGEAPTLPRYWGDKVKTKEAAAPKKAGRKPKISYKELILALASGCTPGEANERAGLSHKSSSGYRKAMADIRGRLKKGEHPAVITKSYGFFHGTHKFDMARAYIESLRD